MRLTLEEIAETKPAGRLDGALRFDSRVAEIYEREYRPARTAQLRHSILVGLILYNVYNVESFFAQRDILFVALLMRLAFVTPGSLLLAFSLRFFNAPVQEIGVTIGMINAVALPCFLFWLSNDPLSGYTFGEIALTLMFGNMLLALRFSHAVVFTGVAFAMGCAAVLTKDGLDPSLRVTFVIQITTACLFTLYANHRMESARGLSFLAKLRETLKSQRASEDSRRFRDLSLLDGLTGLPNRRSLDGLLDGLAAQQPPLAVMMIDVDHFKLFNDTLGHPAGDDCLRSIGLSLERLVGASPHLFVARFGGEEFTLVATGVEELEAARIASGLVRAVSELAIAHPGRSDGIGVVTISVGIALKPASIGTTPQTILLSADTALYRAKKSGRNRFALDSGPGLETARADSRYSGS